MTCKLRRSQIGGHYYEAWHTPHNVLIEDTMYTVCCWCGQTKQASLMNDEHVGHCGNYFTGKTMADIKMNIGENSERNHSLLVNVAKDGINAVVADKDVTVDHTLASLVALRSIIDAAIDALESAPQ